LGLDPANLGVKDIARLAQQGHPEATAVIRRGGGFLGVGIAAMVNLLNPELVVVGGGVAQIGDLYFDAMRHNVRERAMPYVADTSLIGTVLLGNPAGSSIVRCSAAGANHGLVRQDQANLL
jgi:predicted NBD/HSP70 family sugar kinase